MAWLEPSLSVVVLLGIMILVHELGHYWAAVGVGIKVETFSIGFGPRLFGFRRGETDFRLSAIPIGGYVRMLGELPGDESTNDPRSFQAKARWQRAIVVIAGPVMNIILAVGIVTGLYMYAFPKEVDSRDPVITSVAADSAAFRAGLQPGDRIVQIASQKDPTWQDVLTREAFSANHPLSLVVLRKDARLNLTVTPAMDPKQGIGVAGWNGDPDIELFDVQKGSPAAGAGLKKGDLLVSINGQPVSTMETVQQQVVASHGSPVQLVLMRNGHFQKETVTPAATGDSKLPWRIGVAVKPRGEIVKLSFFPALMESIHANERYATLILDSLRSIIERRISPKTLHGPIGIAQMSNEAAHEGPLSYLGLMAVVSLNLAVINLLPVPILDGGTLLMLVIEMLLQREVSMQVKETVFKLGFVFLMMVFVFVIYNDISRIMTNS
ncbi:MAG: RIP metalloprotease RseP [Acidobacteriaceae bacterium]|nr:RIP metalloprotease RseP [Acidobacteriaceae bacterium]